MHPHPWAWDEWGGECCTYCTSACHRVVLSLTPGVSLAFLKFSFFVLFYCKDIGWEIYKASSEPILTGGWKRQVESKPEPSSALPSRSPSSSCLQRQTPLHIQSIIPRRKKPLPRARDEGVSCSLCAAPRSWCDQASDGPSITSALCFRRGSHRFNPGLLYANEDSQPEPTWPLVSWEALFHFSSVHRSQADASSLQPPYLSCRFFAKMLP